MSVRRTAAAIGALAVAPLALSLVTAAPAAAHGSMDSPLSRVRGCFLEGPESPQSAACRDAVAIGGTQALYDWNEVNIAAANGRHRDLIPDGSLCSAGREKYAGLDQPRADWPATALDSGRHTFRYTATAPHVGSFELFITQAGYDPAQPLKWSDLEHFGAVTNPSLENGAYVFDLTIPEREGRHLIYSVWQRSDSPEAFYTCSDVVFGADSGGGPPAAEGATEDPGHGERPAHAAPAGGSARPEAADGTDAADAADGTDTAPSSPQAAGEDEPAPGDGAEDAGPAPQGGATEDVRLAATGDSQTTVLALTGATTVALGAAVVLVTLRRRTLGRHRA